MTDSGRDEEIESLKARVRELELDTLQQRERRELRNDPFYQHSMDALNPWSDMNQPHPIEWIKKLWRFALRISQNLHSSEPKNN